VEEFQKSFWFDVLYWCASPAKTIISCMEQTPFAYTKIASNSNSGLLGIGVKYINKLATLLITKQWMTVYRYRAVLPIGQFENVFT